MKKPNKIDYSKPAKFSTKELSKVVYEVFKKEPYVGAILQEIEMGVRNDVPTAGICYNKSLRRYQILISPNFFDTLTVKQRVAVIIHEILHFTNFHLDRMGINSEDVAKIKDMQLRNVAADMSINQYIADLPDFCVNVKEFKLNNGKPFPTFQTYETYYELLQKNKEANKDKLQNIDQNGETLDVHNWEELSEEEKEAAVQEMKGIYKRAIEKNSVHKSVLEAKLNDLIKELDVSLENFNAKRILSHAIKKFASSIDRQGTWKRPNKRFGNIAPGTSNAKIPKLNIYMDTSGSRSHIELNTDIKIIKKFLKVGSRTCNIGLWTTELYKKRKFKLNDSLLQHEVQTGGTCINEVVTDINKSRPDLSLILTDGAYDWNGKYPSSETIVILVGQMVEIKHPMSNKIKTIKLNNLK